MQFPERTESFLISNSCVGYKAVNESVIESRF